MNPLTTGDFTEPKSPCALFQAWMDEARRSEPNDPNAMALATVDADGLPNVRMVLLKGVDENGFVFYTNTESNKGRELLGQPKAAIVLHWKSLRRQIRARGPVTLVSDARGRRLFPEPPARQPHRRLGEPAIAAAGEPLRAGEGGGAQRGQIRHRRGPAPAATGRASASRRSPSSSGRTSRSASTTASSSRREGEGWRKVRLYP